MRASCLAHPEASRAPKRPGHPAVNTSQPTLVVGQPQKRTIPAESAGGVRCALPPPLTEALASSAPASGVPSARPDAPQGVQTLVHHVSELRGWLRGACISSLARTLPLSSFPHTNDVQNITSKGKDENEETQTFRRTAHATRSSTTIHPIHGKTPNRSAVRSGLSEASGRSK